MDMSTPKSVDRNWSEAVLQTFFPAFVAQTEAEKPVNEAANSENHAD